ncbi:MAG: glycogen/starch/alpha-glucan phosphorylase, partial [Eubacterium sp.]|nr:glycogen/starch/alpha-glucan phosphorylase [Eubacterium sp.]
SVNGVSALHSEILKDTLFNDFYKLTPEKFSNVTNGIAFRRWICQSNPRLTEYITSLIGDKFITESDELLKLREFADDKKVLAELAAIKRENKVRLAKYIKKTTGFEVNPDSIFDVQAKRLHEYKRQQLNILNIIAEYQMLKANPNADFFPKTYIFAAKAAPGYRMAKLLIQLIDSLSQLINNDPDVNKKLSVIFIEDYSVTIAELLMPAADISEQISLAGKEASGTGNMKLMLNGAVTLGTLDGANVEIHEAVGSDNIFLFGLKTPEVEDLHRSGYYPMNYYNNNEVLRNAVDFISAGIWGRNFEEVANTLKYNDPYMTLADFADYQKAQALVSETYKNTEKFTRMSLMNISGAGIFSADRAIMDYANRIWHTKPIVFEKESAPAPKKSTKKPAKEEKAEKVKKPLKKASKKK